LKGETNYLSGKRAETVKKIRNTETLTGQRKQLSDIRVKDLKGNWTHDKQKVPNKSQIDYSARLSVSQISENQA
jgi:hypothetical protein